MDIVNCTPHDVIVYSNGVEVMRFPKSQHCIRLVALPPRVIRMFGNSLGTGWVVEPPIYTHMEGAPKDTTKAILVSMPVGQEIAAGRINWDAYVFGPDSSPDGAVRDDNGNIVGTKGLIQYWPTPRWENTAPYAKTTQ